ncbi:hypothetical protein ACFQ9X_13905 [Catenulispora yoronensis]
MKPRSVRALTMPVATVVLPWPEAGAAMTMRGMVRESGWDGVEVVGAGVGGEDAPIAGGPGGAAVPDLAGVGAVAGVATATVAAAVAAEELGVAEFEVAELGVAELGVAELGVAELGVEEFEAGDFGG